MFQLIFLKSVKEKDMYAWRQEDKIDQKTVTSRKKKINSMRSQKITIFILSYID